MEDDELAELRELALAARAHAYAPYSNFAVGAALRMDDGASYGGCNVENAAYGLTMCAERVALGAAIAQGAHRIVAAAVASDAQALITPCGACRQVLFEFAVPQTPVWCLGPDGWQVFSLGDLLPFGFDLP